MDWKTWLIVLMSLAMMTAPLWMNRLRIDSFWAGRIPRSHLDLDRADALLDAKQHETVEGLCREVLRRHPRDHEALVYLCAALGAQNRTDEACRVLLPLCHGRATDPWVFYQMGYLCYNQGMSDSAAWYLDRGLEYFPENTELLSARARLYYETENYLRALGTAEQALLREPEDTPSLWVKALSLSGLGSHEEARGVLKTIREIAPEDPDVASQVVLEYLLEDKPDEALENCDRELMMTPKNPDLYRMRARVFLHTRQFEKALEQLHRAEVYGAAPETIRRECIEPMAGLGRLEEAYANLNEIIHRESQAVSYLHDHAKGEYPILSTDKNFNAFLDGNMNIR